MIEEPTLIEVGASWVFHPLAISSYLFISLIGVLFWLRSSNAIEINMLEDELIEDDPVEEVEEEFHEVLEDVQGEDYAGSYEEHTEWDDNSIDEPVKVRKKRVDGAGTVDEESVKKVKSVKKRAVKKKMVTDNTVVTKRRKAVKSIEDYDDESLD